MSGISVRKDYVWVHVEKTGSSTVDFCLLEIEKHLYGLEAQDNWIPVSGESYHRASLSGPARSLPVITTIRNPYTWYVSYWNHFSPEPNSDGIDGHTDFNTWVAAKASLFPKLYKRRVPDNATNYIRLENQTEDILCTLRAVYGNVTPEMEDIVAGRKIRMVRRQRQPYRDYYTPENIEKVSEACGYYLDRFYGSRDFPEELDVRDATNIHFSRFK